MTHELDLNPIVKVGPQSRCVAWRAGPSSREADDCQGIYLAREELGPRVLGETVPVGRGLFRYDQRRHANLILSQQPSSGILVLKPTLDPLNFRKLAIWHTNHTTAPQEQNFAMHEQGPGALCA